MSRIAKVFLVAMSALIVGVVVWDRAKRKRIVLRYCAAVRKRARRQASIHKAIQLRARARTQRLGAWDS